MSETPLRIPLLCCTTLPLGCLDILGSHPEGHMGRIASPAEGFSREVTWPRPEGEAVIVYSLDDDDVCLRILRYYPTLAPFLPTHMIFP